MLPSVTVVLGGKPGNAVRQGDSCTVSRSPAKIVVSRKGLTRMRVCTMIIFCSHHFLFTTWACSHTTSTCSLCNLATQTNTHEIIGLDIQASTEDYLRDLKKNHKKKGKGMFGSSQCDNARKGKKV